MHHSSRIKNPYAFRWLVIILGCLALAGWLLWRSQAPDGEPPIIPFIVLTIAVAILFDRGED
jgi:hypothetical protein